MSKELDVTVENLLGLHARPAAMLVRKAMGFKSDIFLEKDGERVNAKSIMGIMMLAAGRGSIITIRTEGKRDKAALNAIVQLIEERFGEAE